MNRFQILKGEAPPPKKPPVYQTPGVFIHANPLEMTVNRSIMEPFIQIYGRGVRMGMAPLELVAVRNDPVITNYIRYE